MLFQGLGVALVTPFDESGINYRAAENLLDYILPYADAVLPLGTTGEASILTAKEREDYLRFVVKKVNGKIPVIVGVGSNNTRVAAENAAAAEKLGADGLLAVTPYYNKCTQAGLVAYYREICANTSLPLIAYNVPSRTGVNILPETAEKLCGVKGVCGIKEASGNMSQIMETLRLTDGKIEVYCGDDGMTVPVMCMGGSGVISVAANVAPKLMKNMCDAALSADYNTAAKIQKKLLPLVDALFCEVNPIPVKHALKLLGIDCGIPRSPLTEITPPSAARLEKAMRELGLIEATKC